MPNKLSQFWQELKRRRVHRLMAIYAGSAYVIFEASTLIFPRWGLPDWTIDLVLYLLILGTIVTFVMGWIYDLTPDGIQKTGPVSETTTKEASPTPNGWKIASYISLVVIVVLIILNIIPRTGKNEILEKSIAVLPFTNLSQDEENTYFIDAVMGSILDNLSKIEDLRVPGRTSVIQYREQPKPIPIVAEEMNVAYVLEGNGQKIGNRLSLTVQLIIGKEDRLIWSKPYDRIIEKVEDLIDLQKEIAELVAKEIEAIITPEEKQIINTIPTTSLTAYEFYQRAVQEHLKHWLKWNDMEAVERAEKLYHRALEYDSTFAQAYEGLANVYWHKNYGDVLSENYLDSMLILLNIALSYDDQLASAYVKKGDYYRENNDKEKAIKEYDKALEINPNIWVVYLNSVSSIGIYNDEAIKIEYLLKSASLHRGFYLSRLYRYIAFYLSAYSQEKSNYYLEEALKLDDDSADHFLALTRIEGRKGDFDKAIEYGKKSYAHDSTINSIAYLLGINHTFLGQYEESLKYFRKYEELNILKKVDSRNIDIRDKFRIGYAYWAYGFEEEGEHYINEGLKFYDRMLELKRISPLEFHTLYGFAAAYTFQGQQEKAYEYLKLVSQPQSMPHWRVKEINYDPLFDSIRDEPEFQQIMREVETKYQAEHDRVKQWLEENDLL
jgi:TolB-like protein/Tfp pilus assembly protein PilF